MKVQSTQIGSKLKVEITDISDKGRITETIESCADGHCECSSDEYQKVESLEISTGINSVTLNIMVKDGQEIDSSCISDCLSPDTSR
jgi:hypothetical protein